VTPAGSKPLRRLVNAGSLGRLVVELRAETLTIRPYRSRTPLFHATYGEIVRAVLITRPTKRRHRIRRGVL
jgi:hypothetical protein